MAQGLEEARESERERERLEKELQLARQIQARLLPGVAPIVAGLELAGLSFSAQEVGGDYYDFIPLPDGRVGLVIADVSGKGVPAALLSSMLQASLRTQAASVTSPAEILRNINHLMYRSTAIQQFATFFLARVDGERLELSFSNAGHNWPVLQRSDGERRFLERGGLLLGIQEGVEFEEERVSLLPGDLVVLYTDGITEAADAGGEQFGEDRLYAALSAMPRTLPAHDVAEHLLATLRGFLDGTEAQDDITLMVLKVLEPAAQRAGAEPARTESSSAELATRSVPSER